MKFTILALSGELRKIARKKSEFPKFFFTPSLKMAGHNSTSQDHLDVMRMKNHSMFLRKKNFSRAHLIFPRFSFPIMLYMVTPPRHSGVFVIE